MAGEVACLGEDAAELDEGALKGEDTFEKIGFGIGEDLVFYNVDLLAVVIEHGDVGIDNGVEDAVEDLVVGQRGRVDLLFYIVHLDSPG